MVKYGASPGALDSTVDAASIVTRLSVDVDPKADVPRLYKEPAEDAAERGRGHDPRRPKTPINLRRESRASRRARNTSMRFMMVAINLRVGMMATSL